MASNFIIRMYTKEVQQVVAALKSRVSTLEDLNDRIDEDSPLGAWVKQLQHYENKSTEEMEKTMQLARGGEAKLSDRYEEQLKKMKTRVKSITAEKEMTAGQLESVRVREQAYADIQAQKAKVAADDQKSERRSAREADVGGVEPGLKNLVSFCGG